MCYDLASDEAAKKRWRNKVRICRSNSQSHNPLIPGLLVHNEWAGTFEEFEEAVELGDLEAFLRLDTNDRRTPASGLPLPKQAQPPQVPITNAKLPPAPTLMPPLAAPGQSVRILQDNDDILSFLPQETTITDTEVDALLRELEKPLPRTARRTYTPSSRAKTDGPKPLPILPKDRPQATGQPAKYDPDAMLSKNLVSEAARAIGVTPTPRKFAPRMRLNKRPIEQIMSERRARTEQTENTRKNDELFSSLGLSDMKISEEEADAFLNDGIIPAPRRQESSSSKPNTANHAKHGEDSRITDETSRADSKYEPNNFSDAAQPSSKDVEAPVVPDEVGANQDRPCDQPVSTSVTDGSDNVSEPKDADDVLNTSSEQDSTSVENAEEANKSTRPDAPVISKNDILEDQVAHKALDEKTMSFKGVSGEDANKPLSNDGLHTTSSTDISNDQMAINSVSLSNKLRSTEEAAVTSTCKQPFLERTEKEAADLVGLHDKEQKESDVYATSKSEIKPEKHTHQPIHHHFIVRRKDSLNNELAKKCTAEDHALSEKLTTDKVSKDELLKIDGCHKPLDSLSLPESDGCTSEIRLTDAEQKNRVSASESNQKAGQVAQPELGSELDAEHEHEHEPESKPEPEPEEVPEVEPEAKPESQPELGPESKPEPEPEEVPDVEPEAKPESQPEPELESKPLLEPKFVPEHKSEAKPDSETEAESKPKVESEPEEVLEAAPKPKPEAAPEPAPVHEGLTEPEPVLEPVPKPESEAVPGVEDIPEAVLEPEPAEVSAPVPKSRVVVEAEAEAVPEAVPEPNSAQETIPKPEPVQHPELRSRARAVPFVEGETLATLDSNNNQSSDSLDVEPKKSLYVPEAKRAPDHSSENDSQVQMADTLSDTPHIESSDAPEKQATLVHDAGFKIKDSPQPDEAQQQGRTDSSIKEDEATESTRLSANSVPDADTVEEFNKEFASGSNQPESKSVNLAGNQLDHDAKKESADINLTASSHEGTQNDTDLTESIKPTAASAKVGNDQHDGMSHDVTRGSENPMKSNLLFDSGLDSKDEIYESQNEPEHTSLSSSVLSRDNKLDQHDDGHNFTQSVQDTLDQQAKTPGDSLMASVEAMTSTQSSIASPSQKTSLAERLQRATKTPPAIPPAKRGTDTPMEPDAKLDIWANKSVQDPVSIQGASTETAISKETAEISECDGDVTTRIHPELDSAGGMDRSLDYLPQDRPEHHTAASDHASLEDTAESLGATSNSSSSDDETDSNIPDLWVTSKLTAENPHEISLDQSRGINDARRPRTEHPFKEQSAAPVERTPELALQRQMENVTLASSPQAQAATPRDDSRTDIPAGDIRCVASKPAVHVSATVTERDLPTPPPLIRPQRHTNPRSRIPPPAESTSNDAQVPAAKPPSLPPRRVRRDLKETRAVSEMPPQALLAPTQPPSLPHRMRSDAAAGENARRIVSETPGFGAARSEDISSTKSPRARRTLSDIMREADQILQEWK